MQSCWINYLACLSVSVDIKYINKSTGGKQGSVDSCCSTSVIAGNDAAVVQAVVRETWEWMYQKVHRMEREAKAKMRPNGDGKAKNRRKKY